MEPVQRSASIERLLAFARIDFEPGRSQPSWWSLLVATIVSLAGSLGADGLLVAAGTRVFPATKGFAHFRFGDYATLTIIGVVIACVAWPVVTRISSDPRWLFFRLAILVTLVLWLPDVWILSKGEQPKGVLVLALMHLAIALVTYNALVHIAPVRPERQGKGNRTPATEPKAARGTPGGGASTLRLGAGTAGARAAPALAERRFVWWAMCGLVAVELALGIACTVLIPAGRPTGLVPSKGSAVYFLHLVAGVLLGVGAIGVTVSASRSTRPVRVSSLIGLVGVAIGAVGGLAAVFHGLRIAGIGLMFVGALVACVGYLMPAVAGNFFSDIGVTRTAAPARDEG